MFRFPLGYFGSKPPREQSWHGSPNQAPKRVENRVEKAGARMRHATDRKIEIKVAWKPADAIQEVNSPLFMRALLGGAPAANRAFRALVEATHAQLARYIGRYFRDKGQVQDVLQETYMAAHRALPRFEGKSKLTTWVYSLAYHKICNRLSEKYRARYVEVDPESPGLEPESDDPLVDEVLHRARMVQWVKDAAEDIPVLYRDAYRLRDMEGLTGEEAAETLGISTTLIRVRLHRARCMIVERLQKLHPAAFAEGVTY